MSTNATARVVVVGGGVMGAWTALWLRRRGIDVILIDQYGLGNVLGSSGDETRVTRSGHGRDDFYPWWQRRALTEWKALESSPRRPLFWPTGVLWLAASASQYEDDCATTLEHLEIPVERWGLAELSDALPWIRTDGLTWALYEPEAGAIAARDSLITVAGVLASEGTSVLHESVQSPEPEETAAGRLTSVKLSSEARIEADSYVFACGPWLPRLFPRLLGSMIRVTRQEVTYFATPPGDDRFEAGQMPVWIEAASTIYGLPSIDRRGFKVAPDWPGPVADPDAMERRVSEETVHSVRQYLGMRFPDLVNRPLVEARVCQYESTPDTHFLIDRHPAFENVWLVGGGSGHGFKHGPVVGEYVAALVADDTSVVRSLAPPDARFALPPARRSSGTSGAATSRLPPTPGS
jgi:glycine/D-amino acid oxidase-like deaminating enzyme